MVVRPPRVGDEGSLGPLHNHVWRVAYADLMPKDYLERRSDVQATRRWEQLIGTLDSRGRSVDGRAVVVAEVDDRIVGFMMVGPARDREMDGCTELMSLYVSPDVQGTGVAQELVHHGLPKAPGYLWVLEGNRRAQAFYLKLGYHLDGASTSHEPTGALEVRMVHLARAPAPQ